MKKFVKSAYLNILKVENVDVEAVAMGAAAGDDGDTSSDFMEEVALSLVVRSLSTRIEIDLGIRASRCCQLNK